MRPTARGWKIIICSSIFLTLSALFSDKILMIFSILLVILLLIMFLDLVRKTKRLKSTAVEPSTLNLKMVAGNEGKAFLKFRSEVAFKIHANENWITFQPNAVQPPETLVTLTIKPMLSGIYELTSIKIELSDYFEFFQVYLEVPISLRLEAYPRVFPWVLEALSLLGEAKTGFGDLPGKRRGKGLEYLWSREYQAGDDISLIDWKATARHQKIFVKEFLEEAYGSVKIIYDVRAHGPITGDECSAYFLSTIVSFSITGLPMSITIKNGNELLVDQDDLNPAEALKLALAYIVENYLISTWDIYELFEPKSARALLKISREIGSKAFMRISELRLSDFLKRLSKILKDNKGVVIYIGCILIDSDFVKNLATEISNLGGNMVVLSPQKPWLDARDLEEAYLMYQSNEKLLKALEGMSIDLTLRRHP